MSSSSEILKSGRFMPARSSEKLNFSQKCSRLSQYLKENGSLGDLSLDMNRNLESNGMAKTCRQRVASMPTPTMNLFPQQAGFGSSFTKEELPKTADFRCVLNLILPMVTGTYLLGFFL
ncbi:unnamed protein product [Ilex paraguariensis]|uniref:Uncharacterized protein n=1 Tax=Ilex paraguariensis TaxID=185542 RepID=A0ABC8SDB6_9AQUA